MKCTNCGAEISEEQKFCIECGKEIEKEKISDKATYENNGVEKTKQSKKNHTPIIIIACFAVAILASALLAICTDSGTSTRWDEYIKTHPIDNTAIDFTYQVDARGLNTAYFSSDLSQEHVISSQVYDIDNDNNDELLQTIIKEDTDRIDVCLEVTRETNGSFKTDKYAFNDVYLQIPLLTEGDYYLYKSDKDTFVLFENFLPQNSYQECSAGIISQDHKELASYTLKRKNDEVLECYDRYNSNEPLFVLKGNTESGLYGMLYVSRMSELRLLFAEKGLKGFLTGIDDIDKVTDYIDLTPIGKFSVTIDEYTGRVTYENLLKKGE